MDYGSLALKIGLFLLLGAFLTAVLLFYVAASGVPFVEGDRRIASGSAYGFRIGMSKAEVFDVIKTHYARDGYSLRALWEKNSPEDAILAPFENTDWKKYPHRKHGEHKSLIKDLSKLEAPYGATSHWDIDVPSGWVNRISLQFEDERLVEVRKSRWLFERP